MKGKFSAAVLVSGMLLAGAAALGAAPEPEGISLLRIELKKALLQQDVAPKMTQLKQKKLTALQGQNAEDTADAEIDVVQAQATEAIANVMVKELELQLKEALRSMNAGPGGGMPPPPPPPSPAGQAGQPAGPVPPTPPMGPGQPQGPQQEPAASPAEISLLEMDLQKAKINADAAGKVADNRQKLFTSRQESGKASAGQLADAEADALAAQSNARLAELEVEASQLRLDDAVKSAGPRK